MSHPFERREDPAAPHGRARSTGALGFAALAAVAGIMLATRAARAQGDYRSVPLGGRSTLMGDTGVVFGRDGASPFVNPATIVRIQDAKVALSGHMYQFTVTKLAGIHRPGAVDTTRFPSIPAEGTSTSDSSVNGLPSTVCVFFTLGRLVNLTPDAEARGDASDDGVGDRGRQKAAFCIGNVDRDETSLPVLNHRASTAGGGFTQQSAMLTRSWRRYQIGPSFAFNPSDSVSVGLSVHAAYTLYRINDHNATLTSGGPGGAIASSFGASSSGRSLEATATLGATWRVFDGLAVGAGVLLPAIHVLGQYRASQREQYGDATGTSARTNNASGDFEAPPPTRITLGVGVAPTKALKIEVDGAYTFAQSEAIASSMEIHEARLEAGLASSRRDEARFSVPARATFDVGLGAEWFVGPRLSILGGFSADRTSTPPLESTTSLGAFYKGRMSRVGLSAGVGSYGDPGDIHIGTELSYGWGDALAANPYVIPNKYDVIGLNRYGVMFILAGSTSFRAIRGAVRKVRSVGDEPADRATEKGVEQPPEKDPYEGSSKGADNGSTPVNGPDEGADEGPEKKPDVDPDKAR